MQANIKSAIGESSEDAIAAIDEKLVELQNELLKQANAKKDYERLPMRLLKGTACRNHRIR